jgi:hypothetical protein
MNRLGPLWSHFDELSPVMLLERENLYFHLNRIKKEKLQAEQIITKSILEAAAAEKCNNFSQPCQSGQKCFFCAELG